MKKILTLICSALLLASCSETPKLVPAPTLVGEWDSKMEIDGKPDLFLARFKSDGSYDALGNGKLLVSGNYRTNGDTIFFRDGFCGLDFEGSYRYSFKADSVRFDLISDTCQARIHGSDKVSLARTTSSK